MNTTTGVKNMKIQKKNAIHNDSKIDYNRIIYLLVKGF